MTQDDIISAARSAIGTPFAHQGRSAGKALDCAGLLLHVAHELGVEASDVAGYSHRPSCRLLEATLDKQPSIVRVQSQPQPGDLLLMRFRGDPQHLAVCAGDTLIHSYESVGKVCEHGFSPAWQSRVVRVYRFRQVEVIA